MHDKLDHGCRRHLSLGQAAGAGESWRVSSTVGAARGIRDKAAARVSTKIDIEYPLTPSRLRVARDRPDQPCKDAVLVSLHWGGTENSFPPWAWCGVYDVAGATKKMHSGLT